MEILKTYIEEQPLIKYCLIKHLILLKSSKYNAYQRGLASIVCKFLIKKTTRANTSATSARSDALQSESLVPRATPNKFTGGTVESEIMLNRELDKNYTNRLLENSKKEKYNHFCRQYFGR